MAQTNYKPQEQGQINNESERPVMLTIYCVVVVIYGIMQSLLLFINKDVAYSSEMQNMPFDTTKMVGVAGLSSIGGVVGIWQMKRWGTYLIFLNLLLADIAALVILSQKNTIFSIFSLVIPFTVLCFYLIPIIVYWKRLR